MNKKNLLFMLLLCLCLSSVNAYVFEDGSDGDLIFTTTTKSYGNLIVNVDYYVSGDTLYLKTDRTFKFKSILLGNGAVISTNYSNGTLIINAINNLTINGTIDLSGLYILSGSSGGAGGNTNVYGAGNYGGSGGAAGIIAGTGGGAKSCVTPFAGQNGASGGISSGGSGACGMLDRDWATSGIGGNAFGNNGGNASCLTSGSGFPVSGAGGGGGAGGNGGKSGLNLILNSQIININGVINLSGTVGNNGGNGGSAAHCGYAGSGASTGGAGGNGGSGGNGGNLTFTHSNNLSILGTLILSGAIGGIGGAGGESRTLNNVFDGYGGNGTNGTSGVNGINSSIILYADNINPNLTIIEPNGSYSSITYIPLWINASDDFNLSVCWYNVTKGISTEVSTTIISNCNNTQFVVSTDATYLINVCVNDTSGNINCTSNLFTTINYIPPVIVSGGGGGGGITIIQQLTEIKEEYICKKAYPPLQKAYEVFMKDISVKNFITLWYSYWTYTLCSNSASFIPI